MFEAFLDRLGSARDTVAERRGPAPREAVAWPAMIEVGGALYPIEIGNISTGGLMARIDVAVPPGTRVTLLIEGARLGAEVRWQREGRVGVRFDAALSIDCALVDRYRAEGAETARQMSRWMV